MAICEQCGKEHEGTFGSGRFCCRSCSNKWVALNQSDEAKARKVEAGKKNLVHDGSVGFCAKGYWTFENRQSMSDKMISVMSNQEIRDKISKSMKSRYVSNDVRKKISESMIKAVREGRHKGFQYAKHPYSEEYIKGILDKEGIRYIRQYPFKYKDSEQRERFYFLDFYLEDFNIDLEVDGSFHRREPQLSMDKLRDERISKSMKIFRFFWSYVGSKDLDAEVRKLLDYIRIASVV